jgi:hypothetical protein
LRRRHLVPIGLVFLSAHSHGQAFDWSLLSGKWAESAEAKYGCRADNVHQTFSVSADKKRLTFVLDRKWKIGAGEEMSEYGATIVSAAPNVLIIRYGPELKDIPEEMREWEMRFVGPGTYRWRATAWREGVYNQVIGVKCSG